VDKELVIVVPGEAAARSVFRALEGLDDEGSIELYAATVIAKNTTGTLTVTETLHPRAAWAMPLALSSGALLGLLGGIMEVIAGARIDGAARLGGELAHSGFPADFVHDVAVALKEQLLGRAATLQDVWAARIASIQARVGAAKAEAKARRLEHAAKLTRFAAARLATFHDLFV
jgi:uncharacterized membrane protein